MVQRWRRSIQYLANSVVFAGTVFFLELPGFAQLVPDNSLGAENSVINSGVDQSGQPADIVSGGARRSSNLFHSFQEFNVETSQQVYFASPTGVENILTRVTGSNPSNILGTLGVLSDANLFLINPNGIIFGPNARLDVTGSFVASTADRIRFADGVEFSTVDPSSSPLITVSVPIGLQYGSNPGALQVQGSTLNMLSGQTLALLGGDVTVDGGRLFVPGGRVEIAGVAADGFVDLVTHNSLLQLSFPASTSRANVVLRGETNANVRAGNEGNIAIHARNLNISGESILQAGIESSMGSVGGQAGNIEINAVEAINLADESLITNRVAPNSTGNGGNINLTSESLFISNNARLSTSLFGEGNAGNVVINTRGTVRIDQSSVFSQVGEQAVGQGGDIHITANSVEMANGSRLDTSVFGEGNAGNVVINAADTVRFSSEDSDRFLSAIESDVEEGGRGNAGNISITTGSLSLLDGSYLLTSSFGDGNTGNVTIVAHDTVLFDGGGGTNRSQASGIVNTVGSTAEGNGGAVNIQASNLILRSNAAINSDVDGQGQGGDVYLDISETLAIIGGETAPTGESARITLALTPDAVGSGGDLLIRAGSLLMTDGGLIKVSTQGQGNAGAVFIDAETVDIIGSVQSSGLPSGIFTSSEATGDAGNILINTQSFRIADGAALSARSRGDGRGGNITVQTDRSFTALNGGQLITTTLGAGQAGNITVNAAEQITIEGSDANYAERTSRFPNPIDPFVANNIAIGPSSGLYANTSSNSTGQGGNIRMTAEEIVIRDNARLSVSTFGDGDGGNIRMTAGEFTMLDATQISASTFGAGDAGNVRINARDTIRLNRSAIFSTVQENSRGDGGNIRINTGSLSLFNGSQLLTSTYGQGNSGNVTINARDTVLFNRGGGPDQIIPSAVFNVVNAGAEGNGGEINIQASRLILRNNAAINSDAGSTGGAVGQGRAGDVNLDISGTIFILGGEPAPNGESARITLALTPGGIGSGGNLDLNARTLVMRNGGQIKVSTQAQGDAGNVLINTETVDISGSVPSSGLPSGIFTSSDTAGNAGDIVINTGFFRIADGSALSARSRSNGQGGNITVNASQAFEATGGGQLVTTTFGQGQAGNIRINAGGSVNISGRDPNYFDRVAQFPDPIDGFISPSSIRETGPESGLYANTEPNSTGQGGNITMVAEQITIRDRAQVTASSDGSGRAGNIGLSAPAILLDNRASIASDTVGGQGDITLRSPLLLLRRNSTITTNAGGTATGGNINVDADFIVSVPNENNDIIANANEGSGGQITLAAEGIFGVDVRTREDLQQLLNPINPLDPQRLQSNDVTAFSQSNPRIDTGLVTVQTPDVDPTQGLTELPTDLTDPSQLIAATCPADEGSSFAITGRGGLPEDPRQPLMGQTIWQDERGAGEQEQADLTTGAIVEAQSWSVDRTGRIVLVAQSHSHGSAAFETPGCVSSHHLP
jgi:filamentous hemagglutinin family protein